MMIKPAHITTTVNECGIALRKLGNKEPLLRGEMAVIQTKGLSINNISHDGGRGGVRQKLTLANRGEGGWPGKANH
jgi:hypothetical protein